MPPVADTPSQLDENILFIDEPYFDAQCRDILESPEDYADTLIRIEGIYSTWEDPLVEEGRHAVIRYHPEGCCGNGMTGLAFYYDGVYPQPDDWIRVTGTIQWATLGQYPNQFLLLHVTELQVMEERGNEHVEN